MRRISADNIDVFRPRGRLAKEIELAETCPDEVISVLGSRLSKERYAKLEDVVAHRTRRFGVAVEGVCDPHNTAAVIRSSDAFGVQTVHIIENETRFLSSRKVTQGSHKWVDIGVWKTPEEFARVVRARGQKIYIAAADAAVSIDDLSREEPLVLVFGNEHEGITDAMRELADGAFAIPMMGFVESFNISVAASLAIARMRWNAGGDLCDAEKKVLLARYCLQAVRAGYDIVMHERKRSSTG